MIKSFTCTCKKRHFEMMIENWEETEYKDRVFFRCATCGRDYGLKDILSKGWEHRNERNRR